MILNALSGMGSLRKTTLLHYTMIILPAMCSIIVGTLLAVI